MKRWILLVKTYNLKIRFIKSDSKLKPSTGVHIANSADAYPVSTVKVFLFGSTLFEKDQHYNFNQFQI